MPPERDAARLRATPAVETHSTTVLSFHYKDGVVIAGDRRATAGNIVMYDRADKVIELDQETVMAIAGSPAVAFEMARTLQTSFQYYRRSQLQPLSLSAKVRALGKLIKDNLPMTLQGVGAVVPILAARDLHNQKRPDPFLLRRARRAVPGGRFRRLRFRLARRAQRPAMDQPLERPAHLPARRRSRPCSSRSSCSTSPPNPTPPPAASTAARSFIRRSSSSPATGLRSAPVELLRESFAALEAPHI